MIEGVKKFS